jgi:hypothetical protein
VHVTANETFEAEFAAASSRLRLHSCKRLLQLRLVAEAHYWNYSIVVLTNGTIAGIVIACAFGAVGTTAGMDVGRGSSGNLLASC